MNIEILFFLIVTIFIVFYFMILSTSKDIQEIRNNLRDLKGNYNFNERKNNLPASFRDKNLNDIYDLLTRIVDRN